METLQQYHDRHRRALDQKTLETFFSGTRFNNDDMVNFINALDLLDEITLTPHFMSNRFLETPDTFVCKADVHRRFLMKKGPLPNSVNKIKKVGYPTNSLIDEFLNGPYVGLFYRMMYEIKENRLDVSKDLNPYSVRLDPVAPHPMYGIIEYLDIKKKNVLKLPFFLNRLGRDHIVARTGT